MAGFRESQRRVHFSASARSFEVQGSLDTGVGRVLVRFVFVVMIAAVAAAAVDTSTGSRALCLAFPDPEYELVEIAILELAAARAFVFEAVVSAVWAVEQMKVAMLAGSR